jgi:hypothetical protein
MPHSIELVHRSVKSFKRMMEEFLIHHQWFMKMLEKDSPLLPSCSQKFHETNPTGCDSAPNHFGNFMIFNG